MDCYDVIVIGGGLLGCFSARSLARYRLKTVLLEAREDLCTGISRANSAIIYSGFDTKPGTKKSSMCVSSAQNFDTLCSELGVRYSQCGLIMVCSGPKGENVLHKKLEQGLENGVRGIRLLSKEEVLNLESKLSPDVRLGLYAPQAGTVIPWELGMAAADNAVHNGVEIRMNAKVTNIERVSDGYKVSVGETAFFTHGVINCAGLYADEILEKVQKPSVRIFPSSGDYFVLDTKASGCISHVVLYESEEKCKGLTLVPTVDGNILVGSSRIPSREKESFETSREGFDTINGYISEIIPSLPMKHVIRSFGAIRPNPYYVKYDFETGSYLPCEKRIDDFTIIESEGNPAFLSLVGIKTPGLTCADALGRHIADRMAALLGAQINPQFDSKRSAPLRLNDIPFEERARIIRKDPAYGKIVCRCRRISEGEIIDSIRMFPGAVTVDGVKRRTGACSGRCQGSFCTQKIIEILARELNVSPEKINKNGPGSYIMKGETG